MSEAPLQFYVVRTGEDEFKIIVQGDRTILRSYNAGFARARDSIIQELLALEVRR